MSTQQERTHTTGNLVKRGLATLAKLFGVGYQRWSLRMLDHEEFYRRSRRTNVVQRKVNGEWFNVPRGYVAVPKE